MGGGWRQCAQVVSTWPNVAALVLALPVSLCVTRAWSLLAHGDAAAQQGRVWFGRLPCGAAN